jgi:hypothetical protein
MRAEPFIQAELRRGDVMAEAFGQVQEYSLMRHKAAVEVQMSESLLAAEEEMRNFARDMENSPEIYNVFKPDGSGAWSETTVEMRERLADSIESRSARDEFRARFNQREQAVRFTLQDEVDRRIKARAAAAAASRMKSAEDFLSDPFNATPADYDMVVLGIRTDEDAAIRSGTATAQTAATMNRKLAENIAARTAAAYVFDDPTRAIALAEALDLQDEVDAGTMTAEDAYARSGLTDDAAYTLYTLDVLPREQALEIIYGTLSRSNRLYEAAEKRREEVEARDDASRDRAYRGMFMFADPSRQFTVADLMMAAPRVAAQYIQRQEEQAKEKGVTVTVTDQTPVTADQAREAFVDYFDTHNYLTPEQRKQIDSAFNRPAASSFATETNRDVYTDLFARAETGNLTVTGLNAERGSITSENYTTLLTKIGTEADDALNDAKSVARLRFGYDERIALDTEGAKQAQAAYFSVASQLEQMATLRRAEGNPMTRIELNTEAERLANQQLELFRIALRIDRDQYIELRMTNIPGIGYTDPLADLEAWWASLNEAEQKAFKDSHSTHRYNLLDFQNRMNR